MIPRLITAQPNEALVVIKAGRLTNLGNGASAFVWPGMSRALVPTSAQEAQFSMQQESADGISLRFKGIVIYRIVDPEKACVLSDFSDPLGLARVSQAISDLCLGELRHVASNLSMDRCIRERRTTLTDAVRSAITPVIEGTGREGDLHRSGWGIRLDVVQVAQVYILDKEVFERSQEETKDRFRRVDELSKIATEQELECARMQSEREKAVRAFALEEEEYTRRRQSQERWAAFEEEKITAQALLRYIEMEKKLEESRRQAEACAESVRLEKLRGLEIEALQVEKNLETAHREIELAQARSQIHAIETGNQVQRERALMEIRKEILPIEQVSVVSQALSGIFHNAHLSMYGGDTSLMHSVGQLMDMVVGKVREAM